MREVAREYRATVRLCGMCDARVNTSGAARITDPVIDYTEIEMRVLAHYLQGEYANTPTKAAPVRDAQLRNRSLLNT